MSPIRRIALRMLPAFGAAAVLLAAGLAAGPACAQAPDVTVRLIKMPGATHTHVTRSNELGDSVGYASNDNGESWYAFLRDELLNAAGPGRDEKVTRLSSNGKALCINNQRNVGGTEHNGSASVACLWTPSTQVDRDYDERIIHLADQWSGFDQSVLATNDNGVDLIGLGDDEDVYFDLFRYGDRTFSFPAGETASAFGSDVNNRNEIGGTLYFIDTPPSPFVLTIGQDGSFGSWKLRWPDGIGNVTGGEIFTISDDDKAGGDVYVNGYQLPCVYRDGSATAFPVPPGYTDAFVESLSNWAMTVYASNRTTLAASHLLYPLDPNSGTRVNLTEVISNQSGAKPGFLMVNNRGIVYGFANLNGQEVGVEVTPELSPGKASTLTVPPGSVTPGGTADLMIDLGSPSPTGSLVFFCSGLSVLSPHTNGPSTGTVRVDVPNGRTQARITVQTGSVLKATTFKVTIDTGIPLRTPSGDILATEHIDGELVVQ